LYGTLVVVVTSHVTAPYKWSFYYYDYDDDYYYYTVLFLYPYCGGDIGLTIDFHCNVICPCAGFLQQL